VVLAAADISAGVKRCDGRSAERPGHAGGRPFGRLAEPKALQIAAN